MFTSRGQARWYVLGVGTFWLMWGAMVATELLTYPNESQLAWVPLLIAFAAFIPIQSAWWRDRRQRRAAGASSAEVITRQMNLPGQIREAVKVGQLPTAATYGVLACLLAADLVLYVVSFVFAG